MGISEKPIGVMQRAVAGVQGIIDIALDGSYLKIS
jgi:hypothetical protein